MAYDYQQRKMGIAISQYREQWNTQTGHLDRRTLLHKRYLILRTIGQGGMGAVYQARDLKRQTICAVKEMSLSMVPAEERTQAIQSFKIEAKMLWGLNHPNLPAFTGFFTEGQRYFMVMEYIDGYTLEELLQRNGGPFPERRVLGWARQLCDVLEYLHSQHPPIIFRDMKPGNIMLMRNGRVKLIDFGIARFFRPTSSQDTQLLGTPGFAPPEQYGKTQTDERSDIYSLAITLFQLLTSTLSETGFGLKDVRATNPQISPVVARALEKAASLEPEDRYDSVAAFRRTLLGVGTFVFENGDQATTPEELADLCARYPEEASDYLAAGEIESWLREIGEGDLAREARQLRAVVDDPQEAVTRFLQTVMGPNARIRSYSTQTSNSSQTGTAKTGGTTPPVPQSVAQVPSASRGWFSRGSASPPSNIRVSPRTLDFGQVYPGITAPLSLTITGEQGMLVSGTIRPTESWIIVDQAQFDGMSTRVNVRVNSTRLRGSTHYTGTILISPDEEDTQQDIVVTVEADVLDYATSGNGGRQNRIGKTVGADLDDDEDYDALTMGNLSTVQPTIAPSTMQATMGQTLVGVPPSKSQRDNEYKTKYGQPNMSSTGADGWDPLRATVQQRIWLQRSLTFAAAFMVASLFYTLVSQLPFLIHESPLPPSPWFILVLSGIVPAATLGALLVNWNSSWTIRDTINRACTGMGSALLTVALLKIIWQVVLHVDLAPLQLVVMLLAASISATVGTNIVVSDYILYGVSWALTHMRVFIMALAVVIGGILGFFLTAGFAFGCFTPFGIFIGIGVAAALVLRVDHLMKQGQQKYP